MANKNLREIFQVISENIELGEDFKIEDIPELELPENFNDDFHSNYLTIASAKNNSEIMGHFKGKYLSSYDLKLKNGFITLGGTEEEFNQLKSDEADSLKLVDLVISKAKELKIPENPIPDDSALKDYKAKTAQQISDLKAENAGYEDKFQEVLSQTEEKWRSKLKDTRINSELKSIDFGDSMDKEDLIYLTKKRLDDSDYLIQMNEDLSWKILDKKNPESEAIIDGKPVTLDYVLKECSQSYRKKSDTVVDEPVIVNVQAQVADISGSGKYTPGHADYGKI